MDILKAEIALKRKTYGGADARPAKYMRRGDIERMEMERKAKEEREAKERSEEEQQEREKGILMESKVSAGV